MIAENVSTKLGITTIKMKADWFRYGKRAGYLRNQKMLDENKDISLVLAFTVGYDSLGTNHMIKIAKNAGIPVRHYISTTETNLHSCE